MKYYILMALLTSCTVANAEWYRVQEVLAYNTIKVSKANTSTESVTIRIRNLENIEYIQPKPDRVLLGGMEAISLAKDILLNQLVWVQDLQVIEGKYSADIYPSFERVIISYKENRLLNGDNISKSSKDKLKVIYKKMMSDINLSPASVQSSAVAEETTQEVRDKLNEIYIKTLSNLNSATPKSSFDYIAKKGSKDSPNETPKGSYDGVYERAIFTSDAIVWFREKGQFMQPVAQKLFVRLLQDFQNEASSDARDTHIKIKTIMMKESLFKNNFFNSSGFERGKFTYSCLEWFKMKGQFLPDEVQVMFIDWLRTYQQTHGSESAFMKQRLEWILKNNQLYMDFLDLGL